MVRGPRAEIAKLRKREGNYCFGDYIHLHIEIIHRGSWFVQASWQVMLCSSLGCFVYDHSESQTGCSLFHGSWCSLWSPLGKVLVSKAIGRSGRDLQFPV